MKSLVKKHNKNFLKSLYKTLDENYNCLIGLNAYLKIGLNSDIVEYRCSLEEIEKLLLEYKLFVLKTYLSVFFHVSNKNMEKKIVRCYLNMYVTEIKVLQNLIAKIKYQKKHGFVVFHRY